MLLAMSAVSAYQYNTTRLEINKVEVEVDGKTDTVSDDDTIGKNAKPGSTVEFKVELQNLYTKEEDLDIEDIEVTVTIEEIDDGEDLEETAEISKISADRDKSTTLKFNLPYIIDEDSFNVEIHVEGDDENGTSPDADFSWNVDLEVEKDKHALMVYKAVLTPETISCGKDAYLDLTVLNIGSEDEDEVVITLKNDNLNFNKREEISIDSGTDEAQFKETYFIDVQDTLAAGTYPIEIKAFYDTDRLEDTKKVNLIVEECKEAVTPPVEEEKKKEEVEVVLPKEEEKKEEIVQPPVIVTKEETFWDQYGLAVIIAAYIVVILIGILVLVKLFKK